MYQGRVENRPTGLEAPQLASAFHIDRVQYTGFASQVDDAVGNCRLPRAGVHAERGFGSRGRHLGTFNFPDFTARDDCQHDSSH
jgi:hypothetical protein